MKKSKAKKKKWLQNLKEESEEDQKVPIENLPKKFLWMHVKSGTKIRNVLEYALKEFHRYNCVLWSSTGRGIEKAISCAEIFKRKHEGLHQITKLLHVPSKKSKSGNEKDTDEEINCVPEIHIFLTKEVKTITELGYQAPGDEGDFSKDQEAEGLGQSAEQKSSRKVECIDAEEFAAMGLRTGQKRPKKDQQTTAPFKKNKK